MSKSLWIGMAFGMALMAGVVGSWTMLWTDVVQAAEVTVTKEYIDPVASFGFTQVVAVSANGVKTVQVSGQVAGGANHEEQTEAVCRKILERLAKAGAEESDVVKLVVYIRDMDAAAVQGVKAGKDKVFLEAHQPAATWVGVTNLVSPNALVEIEAVAVVAE